MPHDPMLSADELKQLIRDGLRVASMPPVDSKAAWDARLAVAEAVDTLAILRAQEAVDRYIATLGDEK